ncbi:arsenic transporter [Bacillus sp. Marseille-P3661]|uniref:arsenic transporter n=1 Tax=Bacillus sp. Marseille-P3661 TaxID=1936234 RepID=UPI000C83D955|nr:arsenic transporter [Bacillus sp. Marseille-P3661]
MSSFMTTFMMVVFCSTVLFIMWRPKGINETIPTAIGAALILMVGIVPITDLKVIAGIISGATITILSTIIMSIILDSIGFFKWVALNIIKKSRGSGVLLYFYIILLCFLMTMFFNNDGSILITTPIIIRILTLLNLKMHQKIPYLISGALIATAASAPIAVSNIANLIALKIVGLNLNDYVKMMFVPSMVGIMTITFLLFYYFRSDIPKKIGINHQVKSSYSPSLHPLITPQKTIEVDWKLLKICMLIIVVTRGSFFLLSPFGIPIEWLAILGAVILVFVRWYHTREGVTDIIKKTPWHILIFAFSMYVLVYGLRNIGFNSLLVEWLKEWITSHHLNASLIMGLLLTIMSNLFNNLPAVMIGTLTLTDMGLDVPTLQIAYLANVIGSDIGALLTPVGTLATLIWMFLLRQHGIKISWRSYIKVTIMVIPIGLIVSLLGLYFWINWLFY